MRRKIFAVLLVLTTLLCGCSRNAIESQTDSTESTAEITAETLESESSLFSSESNQTDRGKLLKCLKNPATYVYGFDESGNLVSVKNNDSGTEECIWRNGDLELGVTFDTSWTDTERIICISVVERHCGSIRSYVCCDCAADTQKIVNVYGEVYEYQCDRLCKVFCCRSIGSGFFYDRETQAHWENQLHCILIEFEHDGSGYLKSYQMTDLRSSVTQMFPVLLKRRV